MVWGINAASGAPGAGGPAGAGPIFCRHSCRRRCQQLIMTRIIIGIYWLYYTSYGLATMMCAFTLHCTTVYLNTIPSLMHTELLLTPENVAKMGPADDGADAGAGRIFYTIYLLFWVVIYY